jgi:ABC-2 type transport system permease protein
MLNLNKKAMHRSFSTVSTIIVVLILLFSNFIVSSLNINFDLTNEQLFSISDTSINVLNELGQKVNIFVLHNETQTTELFEITTRLLNEYQSNSSYINLEFKNPNENPQFISQFISYGQPISNGSIIVESELRHRVISVEELYTIETSPSTGQPFLRSINVEPQVTNAIIYTTTGRNMKIYEITGNNETPIGVELRGQLEATGYEIEKLSLFAIEEIPYDASLLWIATPRRDWSQQEANIVREYLQNGGKAIFFVDWSVGEFPNFLSVIESYGLEYFGGVIIERSLQNMFPGDPTALIPNILSHQITYTAIQNGHNILMPSPTAIKEREFISDSISIERLLTTSHDAFAKMNVQSQTLEIEEGDIEGQFATAFAIKDSYDFTGTYETRIVVITSEHILNPGINQLVGGSNYDFIINSINWTQGEERDIFIRPKDMSNLEVLTISGREAVQILIFGVFILPISIFIFGVIIWYRRRKS